MDCRFFNSHLPSLPAGILRRSIASGTSSQRRPSIVAASESRTSKCQFGGLSAPLEPRTPVGGFLSGVLLDDRGSFQVTAKRELKRLAAERNEAAARLQLSLGSDDACLYRRIAELKRHECREAVEDVMYMLVVYKFSEMRVHLVPKLSKCVYNGRLEIWPAKDWELESVHSFGVLEMVREHITAAVGCKVNANITDSWSTTKIQRLRLCKLYAAAILYGYFLKSATLRHYLERNLDTSNTFLGLGPWNEVSEKFSIRSRHVAYGHVDGTRFPVGRLSYCLGTKEDNLRFYVTGFDQEMIQMCAKPKFKEAVNVIKRHSCALFGDEEKGLLDIDDVITTSYASLRRILLEAVAFGSFMWDVENCVNDVYMLEES
ncbi:hypothetical protein OROGR_022223 [Orobanche gracilis]